MLNYQDLIEQGKQAGFTHVAPLKVSTIQLMSEVRDMCATNSCGAYGKKWSCPPGCGDLDTCRERIQQYTAAILVQTVGNLEDEMDYESMAETNEKHKENYLRFYEQLRKQFPNMLALGTGGCTQCKTCTYPDAPCRFPDKMISSMEAYGMLVSQVCQDNNLPYYYGKCTLAYTGCFLLE